MEVCLPLCPSDIVQQMSCKVTTPLCILPAFQAAIVFDLLCDTAQNTAWNLCAVIQTAVYSVNMGSYS